MNNALHRLPILALLGLLTACGGTARAPSAATPATPDPADDTDRPALDSGVRYSIDTAASELRVLVYRGGTLARLGHNHIISSRDLRGDLLLAEPPGASRLTVVLPLSSLVVDDDTLRAEEGDDFPGTIPSSAREGTRENMLGDALLDAARYDQIELTLASVSGQLPDLTLTMNASVRGELRQLALPVTVTIDGATLTAHGQTVVTHAQLGLTPFSVMLGALRVEDEIGLKYRLVARRSNPDAAP